MALKYDVIGKINFGSEVNDILKLNGIKDIEGFKNPSEDNVEDLDCLDNIEAASRVIIDRIENKKTQWDVGLETAIIYGVNRGNDCS